MSIEKKVSEIAEEIYRYLSAHPNSADTIDGVAQWWLLHERYLKGLELVENALELLVEKGLIARRTNPDGNVIYSLVSSVGSFEDCSGDDGDHDRKGKSENSR